MVWLRGSEFLMADTREKIESLTAELAGLDEQIAELQGQWDEAKADHRRIVESMKQPAEFADV